MPACKGKGWRKLRWSCAFNDKSVVSKCCAMLLDMICHLIGRFLFSSLASKLSVPDKCLWWHLSGTDTDGTKAWRALTRHAFDMTRESALVECNHWRAFLFYYMFFFLQRLTINIHMWNAPTMKSSAIFESASYRICRNWHKFPKACASYCVVEKVHT